jgi:hypothetical protein
VGWDYAELAMAAVLGAEDVASFLLGCYVQEVSWAPWEWQVAARSLSLRERKTSLLRYFVLPAASCMQDAARRNNEAERGHRELFLLYINDTLFFLKHKWCDFI